MKSQQRTNGADLQNVLYLLLLTTIIFQIKRSKKGKEKILLKPTKVHQKNEIYENSGQRFCHDYKNTK